jgi:5-methylcytosine-specific restriction endonuclease McrA
VQTSHLELAHYVLVEWYRRKNGIRPRCGACGKARLTQAASPCAGSASSCVTGGVCHIAKRNIMAGELWDLDHVIALINGGKNRETNLAPASRDKHREKTKADVAEKSSA